MSKAWVIKNGKGEYAISEHSEDMTPSIKRAAHWNNKDYAQSLLRKDSTEQVVEVEVKITEVK